ncbi:MULTISPECIES: hypothetical protein [Staphylococcus]|uniref:hypothetical protein n=1 Tax=Staphylococcus TaxID=1279 RepID=UPI001300C963|nr:MULTISPECIES: hypothetical protein [Staphylococcus]MCC4221134.1 hypothetical protein [Staphylococcus saprophyticus]MDW4092111.1 hypothetical protein [Staphylococcus saprophyticus]MDW4180482.1 hypothetical protein [Staphylococcus saprophyticus]MDW4234269.1 hypothetical protein [Staphylococcus saprophyticus]MDW4237559.1 hypothetical protein [Staphylococcus saprophyticus]
MKNCKAYQNDGTGRGHTQLAKVRSMTLYTLCTADYRINLEEKMSLASRINRS